MIGRISIEQTWARLGIDIERGRTEVKQPSAKLQVEQPAADLHVRSAQPAISIDLSEVKSDLLLDSPLRVMRQAARDGLQAALRYAARQAEEGKVMMDQPNVIPKLAERNAWPERQFNVGQLPRSRPSITLQGSIQPEITAHPNPPRIQAQKSAPQINVSRDAVSTYLEQRHSIAIDYHARVNLTI